jgi:hypothetical protein
MQNIELNRLSLRDNPTENQIRLLSFYTYIYLSIDRFLFGRTRVLTHVLHFLYHLSHTSTPFCSGYFGDGSSWTICLGWPWTVTLPISTFQIPRITTMSSGHTAHLYILNEFQTKWRHFVSKHFWWLYVEMRTLLGRKNICTCTILLHISVLSRIFLNKIKWLCSENLPKANKRTILITRSISLGQTLGL